MPYINRGNNVRVYYEVHGHGFPLIFLHPYGMDTDIWRHQVYAFADRYQCVLIDARGHGRSTKPMRGYSMELMAQDDAAVLEEVGIDRALLIGNSMGGMRQVQLTLDHPYAVVANIVISSATNLVRHADVTPILRGLRQNYEEAVRGVMEIALSKRTQRERPEVKQFLLFKALKRFPRRVGIAIHEGDPSVGLKGMWHWDVESQLGQIHTPVLVIGGSEDQLVPEGALRALAEGMPNAELIIEPDVGHFIQLENPSRLNEHIERMVSQCT